MKLPVSVLGFSLRALMTCTEEEREREGEEEEEVRSDYRHRVNE